MGSDYDVVRMGEGADEGEDVRESGGMEEGQWRGKGGCVSQGKGEKEWNGITCNM